MKDDIRPHDLIRIESTKTDATVAAVWPDGYWVNWGEAECRWVGLDDVGPPF